jgi:hypothetical protein
MAIRVRQTSVETAGIVAAHNALKLQIGAASFFHLDVYEKTITAANASDLATSQTLLAQIVGILTEHFADTLAIKVVDPTSLPTQLTPTDYTLAAAITAANLCKASYNTHRASTTYHYTADSTNAVASADATDQTSLNTLLNEMKGDINAHLASGQPAASLRLVSA